MQYAGDQAVSNINSLLVETASAEELVKELKKPEAGFPEVFDRFPEVYHQELIKLRNENGQVVIFFILGNIC